MEGSSGTSQMEALNYMYITSRHLAMLYKDDQQ